MVTDAGVEHFGSLRAILPYIWTELRHVLKGLTPTSCVNRVFFFFFDKFLVADEAAASCVSGQKGPQRLPLSSRTQTAQQPKKCVSSVM